MNSTAACLLIGLAYGAAYGAVCGIYAYRWYARQQEDLDGRLNALREQHFELARRLHELAPEKAAAA